jgi:hypothetical protein
MEDSEYELGRIWRETDITSLKVISLHLFGNNDENYKERQSEYSVSQPRCDASPPKYKSGCCYVHIRICYRNISLDRGWKWGKRW